MNLTYIALLIFGVSNVLWLLFGIGWPSLLILLSLTFIPGVTPNDVFIHSFGHQTVIFLMFTFILSGQLRETGVLRRLIFRFLGLKWARKSFFHRSLLYAAAVFTVGSFVAPTVTFLLFYAFMEELCEVAGYEKGSAEGHILMGLTACLSSISCAATPIAHTFPLMAMNYYEAQSREVLSHGEYFRFAFPLGLLLALACYLLLWFYHRKNVERDDSATQARIDDWLRQDEQPLSRRAQISSIVFGLVLVSWLIPAFVPAINDVVRPWGQAWPAIIGVLILAIIKVKGEPVLNLPHAFKEHVHYGSLLICAAALALGYYMALPELGVTQFISELLLPRLGGLSIAMLLALLGIVTIAMTNVLSNLVTTTLMAQIALPLLLDIAPTWAALGAIVIGFSASLAFALPPSIAHIAIAGGSGWTNVRTQAKVGTVLALGAMVSLTVALFLIV